MKIRKYFDPEIEMMDREELEALQLYRLKLQLRKCYRHSEFYNEKFKKSGIKPDDIQSLEDVVNLPFVTKSELREEQQTYPHFGRYTVAPPETWAEFHPSPGTTGAPVNTIWSHEDVKQISKWTARTMWTFGVRPGDIIQNMFGYGIWVAGIAIHNASRELGCFLIPVGAIKSERQIDYLLNPGSTVLIGTPSYALYTAEKLKLKGISPEEIPLKIGCFGGEVGAEIPATRERIEKGLGIEAFDCYGLAEIGPTIAMECPHKAGIHWIEDHLLVEVIDPETKKPCSPGQAGILVLTHLSKEATPLIRFWTNDLASLNKKKCKCGRTHARSVGGILGRAEDIFSCKGCKIFPAQVEKVIRGIHELSHEFCVELATDPHTGAEVCTIVIEYHQEEDIPKITHQLEKGFEQECKVIPEMRFVPMGTLKRTTMKAKRIIDQREKKRSED